MMDAIEWHDTRLDSREKWKSEIHGVFLEVEDHRDWWMWEVRDRTLRGACQPSMGDKDVESQAFGRVRSREQAKDFAMKVAELFIRWGLQIERRT